MNSIKINTEDRYIKAITLVHGNINHIKDIVDNMTMIAGSRPEQCTSKLEAALPHLKAAIEALGGTAKLDAALGKLDPALAELDAALDELDVALAPPPTSC